MLFSPSGIGWIEVVCGCMFAGKTEELLRRMRLAIYAKQQTLLCKPARDNRYSEYQVTSHNHSQLPAINVTNPEEILDLAGPAIQVVGIDEAHFLGAELVAVAEALAEAGKRVIIAGLDQDYRGVPFEPMPRLLAVAEFVTKVHAICVICGNPANRTFRRTQETERVVVGGASKYEARCRRCFTRQGEAQ